MKILIFLPLLAVFMMQAESMSELVDIQDRLVSSFDFGYNEEKLRSVMSPSVIVSFCNQTLDIEGYVKYTKNLVKDGDIGYSWGIRNSTHPDDNTWIYTVAMTWSRAKVVHWHPTEWYYVTATRKNGTYSIDKMTELNCTKTN